MSGWLLPNGASPATCLHTLGGKTSAPLRGVLRTRFHSSLSSPAGPLLPLAPRGGQGGWRMLLPLQSGWSWFTPTTHQPATLEQDVERYSTQRTSLVAMGATKAED